MRALVGLQHPAGLAWQFQLAGLGFGLRRCRFIIFLLRLGGCLTYVMGMPACYLSTLNGDNITCPRGEALR